MIMYTCVYNKHFKKQLNTILKQRNILEELRQAVNFLQDGSELPVNYRDSALIGNLKGQRHFHLHGDLVVVYLKDELNKTISFLSIGTHTQVFPKRY